MAAAGGKPSSIATRPPLAFLARAIGRSPLCAPSMARLSLGARGGPHPRFSVQRFFTPSTLEIFRHSSGRPIDITAATSQLVVFLGVAVIIPKNASF